MVVGFSERYAENKQGAIAGESYGKDGVSPELPPKPTASQIPPTGLSTHPLLPRDGRYNPGVWLWARHRSTRAGYRERVIRIGDPGWRREHEEWGSHSPFVSGLYGEENKNNERKRRY